MLTYRQRGAVVTYTVNHQRWSQRVTDNPYVVALVELEEQEGLRVLTNIVSAPPADVKIGLPVKVTFLELDDVALPLFEPADALDAAAADSATM